MCSLKATSTLYKNERIKGAELVFCNRYPLVVISLPLGVDRAEYQYPQYIMAEDTPLSLV